MICFWVVSIISFYNLAEKKNNKDSAYIKKITEKRQIKIFAESIFSYLNNGK